MGPIQDTIKKHYSQTTRSFSAASNEKIITTGQYKRIIYSICPGFTVDTELIRETTNNIFNYLNGSGNMDPNKGILIWGDIGTGKSTFIKIIGEALRLKNSGFRTINCSYLATEFAAHGLQALNESTYNITERGNRPVNRAFDELGREPIPAKYYGTELNVMQYILQCRYELKKSVRTFATTNLRPDALDKLYGSYISDRVKEMFNIIELKGKSKRS